MSFLPFGIVSVQAASPTLFDILFSDDVDFGDPNVLSPSNYTLAPNLTVSLVMMTGPRSVRLTTSTQVFQIYEVIVGTAQSTGGTPLTPALSKAFFLGFSVTPSFFAVGIGRRRVRLVFSASMLVDAALTDTASYTVKTLGGVSVPVSAVTIEQSVFPRSLVLELGKSLFTTRNYEVTLVGPVQTVDLLTPVPSTSVFQYVEGTNTFEVALANFTGEVEGGIFGTPQGQVFFSPALQAPVANSAIQVDDVAVCVTAYDEYHFPVPVDPTPFYTWSVSGPHTVLKGTVLWGPFPRLSEMRYELTFPATSMVEAMPPLFDGACSITMQETWEKDKVALLNNSAWKLFDNSGLLVPPLFICADNLAPIPAGADLITIIHMELPGVATMTADMHRTVGLFAAVAADALVTADLTVS